MLSLRARLFASFGLVIALSLLAAGFVSVWLLRDEQATSAEKRIGRLVEPLSRRLLQLQLVGAPPERVAEEMASYARFYEVRILLIDKAEHVTLDTDLRNPMIGEQIEPPTGRPGGVGPTEAYTSARMRHHGDDLILFAPAARQAGAPAGWPFQIQDVNLVVAVPAGDVTAAWLKLLPRLALGGGLAGLVGVVVAILLARRITRPIVQMTHASRAIAQGDYDQRIDVHGDDEVATLGRAFNEMAQQVNHSRHAMRQLLADVSHDLKTPLTSIQGFAQAMLDGVLEDDEERTRAAEIVHEEAERMRSLVEDLLYLSQIEAGQLPLNIEAMDLDGVVTAAAQRMRYQSETADVTIRLALDSAPVMADERRVEQILANLLDNAIRYAPTGSEVLLRTARTANSAIIEVHNGGNPIPEADQPYLFDRFYQVDRSRARSGQLHSGLGLAIVRELAHAQGGDVSVQSAEGAGTVFTVRLPLAPEARPATRRAEAGRAAAAT